MREAKQTWINERCESIDGSLVSNNSKKAYTIVKVLTKNIQESHNTIQNKNGKLLTEEGDILKDGLNIVLNHITSNRTRRKFDK